MCVIYVIYSKFLRLCDLVYIFGIYNWFFMYVGRLCKLFEIYLLIEVAVS